MPTHRPLPRSLLAPSKRSALYHYNVGVKARLTVRRLPTSFSHQEAALVTGTYLLHFTADEAADLIYRMRGGRANV